jgi:hypothetical protein
MVRKINVVDLNEIKTVNIQQAEDIQPIIEETIPEPEVEVPKVEEPKVEEPEPKVEEEVALKKGDAKATCAFCNKLMSVKALRYSHDKNCKGKRPEEIQPKKPEVLPPPAPKTEEPPTPRHSPTFEEIKARAKITRAEIRQRKLNNLVSQAF